MFKPYTNTHRWCVYIHHSLCQIMSVLLFWFMRNHSNYYQKYWFLSTIVKYKLFEGTTKQILIQTQRKFTQTMFTYTWLTVSNLYVCCYFGYWEINETVPKIMVVIHPSKL